MALHDVSLNAIEDFLKQKRIAFVGISREQHNIGKVMADELQRLGHEVFFVNPNTQEIFGQPCYRRLQDIPVAPDAALILTTPAVTNSVVRDCAEAGVRYVWMYRGGGKGSVSPEAVEFCRTQGMHVVPGQCPLMYLEPVRNVHRFHRFFVKLTGKYPKSQPLAQ